MTLPLDLVFVRHGQSEGNKAKRLSEAGDHTAFDTAFRNRHTRSFRLTELGREQAVKTGAWLAQEFCANGRGFDRHITSEYTRAMETAGHLGLPGASWFSQFYLTERDWGSLDICPENEREEKFGEALKMRAIEPFFWRPPNGESFAQLCLRLDRVLYTLHRECSDKRVIIVCHGEVMRAFQVLLERMSQQRFKDLYLSKDQKHRIHNAQILHYTRRNPITGALAKHANWMRMVRPTDDPVWSSGWEEIRRPSYSNEELLSIAALYPATFD